MRIKASGGIRDAVFARELIAAGADRLGCSASVKIVNRPGRRVIRRIFIKMMSYV
jgi:deoxyribose-phosphate aldolase